MVVICNSLVYEQMFSQNLAIFNIWAKNWHFLSKLWQKMAENPKKWLFLRFVNFGNVHFLRELLMMGG